MEISQRVGPCCISSSTKSCRFYLVEKSEAQEGKAKALAWWDENVPEPLVPSHGLGPRCCVGAWMFIHSQNEYWGLPGAKIKVNLFWTITRPPKCQFPRASSRDREVLLEEVGRGRGWGLPWAGAAFQGCPLLLCQLPEASWPQFKIPFPKRLPGWRDHKKFSPLSQTLPFFRGRWAKVVSNFLGP